MSEAAIAPMTNCLACNAPQNTEPATLCEHCLAKATVLLRQGKTPAQIALGRDDIRVVLEGWQESREKSNMPKATNKSKKTVSRETPKATLALAEHAEAARAIAILIPINAVEPNPYQPRKIFSEKEMQELVDSIKEHGVLSPILVRPNPDGETRYQLIAGERRWRASQKAGLVEIEALVRKNVDDQTMGEMAIIENVQRHDMSVIEQAVALRRLITEFNLTADYLAQRIGLSRSVVSNRLRLLDLPLDVQERIAKGELTESHGRALAKYKKFPDFVSFYARHIVEYSLPSKLIESGIVLAGWEMNWSERGQLKEQLVARRLLAELDYLEFDRKADDVLFEYPDVIFPGRWQRDEDEDEDPDLFCLDIDLTERLHQEWKDSSGAGASAGAGEASDKIANALAKAGAGEVILLSDLNYDQYETIPLGSGPRGCSDKCGCRARAKAREDSPYISTVCLNPGHYRALKSQETKAKNKARREAVGKLGDAIALALDDDEADVNAIDKAALPLLALTLFESVNRKSVATAANHLNISLDSDFDFDEFSSYKAGRATRLNMLAQIPNLARFVIEVLIHDELRQAAENDHAKTSRTQWLLGVLGGNDGD